MNLCIGCAVPPLMFCRVGPQGQACGCLAMPVPAGASFTEAPTYGFCLPRECA